MPVLLRLNVSLRKILFLPVSQFSFLSKDAEELQELSFCMVFTITTFNNFLK
jgi:hypothetical protein